MSDDQNSTDVASDDLRTALVDNSSYALGALEDVRPVLFELAAEMDESAPGTYAEALRVSQHALQTVKDQLEDIHADAQALREAQDEAE